MRNEIISEWKRELYVPGEVTANWVGNFNPHKFYGLEDILAPFFPEEEHKNYNGKRTKINRVLGRTEEGFICVEYITEDVIYPCCTEPYTGLQTLTLYPISREEEERIWDLEWAKEHFHDAWAYEPWAEDENMVEAYIEGLMQDCTSYQELCFDHSGCCDFWDEIREACPEFSDSEEWPIFDCIGSGSINLTRSDFLEVYDEELLRKVIILSRREEIRAE